MYLCMYDFYSLKSSPIRLKLIKTLNYLLFIFAVDEVVVAICVKTQLFNLNNSILLTLVEHL